MKPNYDYLCKQRTPTALVPEGNVSLGKFCHRFAGSCIEMGCPLCPFYLKSASQFQADVKETEQ